MEDSTGKTEPEDDRRDEGGEGTGVISELSGAPDNDAPAQEPLLLGADKGDNKGLIVKDSDPAPAPVPPPFSDSPLSEASDPREPAAAEGWSGEGLDPKPVEIPDSAGDETGKLIDTAPDPIVPSSESGTGVDESSGSITPDSGAAEEEPGAAVGEPEGSDEEEIDPFRPDMDWYVVHAYSGFELKAKRALEERIKAHNLTDLFGRIMVPQETVVEMVRGQKKTSNKKFYPGYILVQMIMNEDTWHVVKETPKITGFVGDASSPSPITREEVERIIGQVEEGAASPKSRMSFQEGEQVKVVDGPFSDFNGTIEEVRPEKGKVKVLISIFGRATPVELDFFQVEKV